MRKYCGLIRRQSILLDSVPYSFRELRGGIRFVSSLDNAPSISLPAPDSDPPIDPELDPDPFLRSDPDTRPRPWSRRDSNPPRRNSEAPIRRIPGLNEDPLNDSISKLAFEAIREVDRVAAAGGLHQESVKKTIWTVLGHFRDILREHTNHSSQNLDTPGSLSRPKLSYEEIQKSCKLNDSILSVFSAASKELEALGPQPKGPMVKHILKGMITAFNQILELHGEYMNQVNFATMLHRVASMVAETSHQTWLLQEHPNFIRSLLDQIIENWNLFDAHSYSSMMWSLGKLGPAMRSLTIRNRPYDVFVQDILERSRQHFSSMTDRDVLNLLLGISYSGVSPVILKPFLRSFSKVVLMKCEEFRPRDLCCLSVCYSRLNFRQDSQLLDRICQIAENKIEAFTPSELASFFRGMAFLEHLVPLSFRTKILEDLESRIDEYTLVDMIKIFHGMILLSHYPEGPMLDQFFKRFEATSDLSKLDANTVSSFLMILASVNLPREDSINLCKRHFANHPALYSPSTVAKFLWSLCVLDQIDDPVLEAVEKTTFATLPVDYRSLEHRRMLCKVLIYLRIVQKKDLPKFFTRELEEACYSTWRASLRYQTAFGVINEAFEILGYGGFDCNGSWLMEKIPLRASTAVFPGGQLSQDEDLKLVVEGITRTQLFRNNGSVISLQCRWRQMILESLGWTVVHMKVPLWNRLSSKNERAKYLAKVIQEKTGIHFSKLEEFGVKSEKVDEPMKQEEEEELVNNSDLYASVAANNGEKIQLEPELILNDQLDGRFQNLVSSSTQEDKELEDAPPEEISTEDEESESMTDSDLSVDMDTSTDEDPVQDSLLDTALVDDQESDQAMEATNEGHEEEVVIEELLISDEEDEITPQESKTTIH